MKPLRRLLSVARPQWPLMGWIVIFGLGVAGLNLGQAILFSKVLAGILNGLSLAAVAAWLAAAAFCLLLRALFAGRAEYLGVKAATLIKANLRRELYLKLLDLGPGWVGRTRSGLVQTALVDSLEMIQAYFSRIIPHTLVSLISVLLLPLFVICLDVRVGVIVLGCALAATLIPLIILRLLGQRIQFWWDHYYPLNAEYLDALQGMSVLKSFNASRQRGRELKAAAFEVRDAAIGLVMLELAPTVLVHLLIAGGTIAALGLGALHVAHGTLSPLSLLVILLLTGQCFAPVLTLKRALHYAYYVPTVATSIFELLDAVAPVPDSSPTSRWEPNDARIVLENVSFQYPGACRQALRNISFTVSPGRTTALVGRSGAGKTTVTALLQRFYDPAAGRITLGGKDIREMSLDDLRRKIAVVSQDVYLFHGSIRENLLFARPDATHTQMVAAATMAAAHDFVTAMPDGYETIVGERGLKLSGGERQRIAIARALLKDAPVLVLDEATASIDNANEAAIQKALWGLMRGRTVLIIAHRLSTIRSADRIYVLDEGQLIEKGAHEDLVESEGVYARLAALQEAPL